MLKFRKYFVEFVVWERIPSSLPFGTDVVPKTASEGGMGITCLEETEYITRANLSALVLPLTPTRVGITP